MKKSGFTLIELLAVIVILAIIALIAVPIILNVIEKAREGSAIDSGYNYLDAVENAMALNMLDTSKPDIKDGVYSVSQLNTTYGVQVKGNAPKEGSVTIENGKVKECTLQIDNYELTCNGNELILGKSTLPEHRMADTYLTETDDDDEKLRIMYELADQYVIDANIGYNSLEELLDKGDLENIPEDLMAKINSSIQEASKEYLKLSFRQYAYFLPENILPGNFDNFIENELNESNYDQYVNNIESSSFYTTVSANDGIELIKAVKTNDVPSNAIGSKDISANHDGSVMAWYIDSDNNGRYEMYIGQDGGVIAPIKSSCMFMLYPLIRNVVTIDLSNFDTSYTENISSMFAHLYKLKNINLSNWNTSRVRDMHNLFEGSDSLTSINLSNFDTRNVTDMSDMFSDCYGLATLDVSHFNTLNVTNMTGMFSSCTNLTTLDLSSFDTRNVKDIYMMFSYSSKLTTIYVGPKWTINSSNYDNYNSIFDGCGTNTVTLKP